ncbi:MAG: hypothetical protein PVG38_12265 [Gammaproteobacteria bacterium]|jgi:hypothetical protein
METLFNILLIGAAVGVVVGLLVQIVGTVLFGVLTFGVGAREWWVNKYGPHQSKRGAVS